jgi:uncharacterized protein (TIGR00369 family)
MSEHHENLAPFPHAPLNRCFGCGPANPAGLHLEFLIAPDGTVVSLPAVSENFEGSPGYLHGGVIATLLDEAMAKAVRTLGKPAMTRNMEVDYRRPVPSCVPIRIEGRVVRSELFKHWAEASILNAQGTVLAHGKGLFVQVRPKQKITGQPEGHPEKDQAGAD